ncbi:MAG: O-antigen ligase family protein [Candidatus Moranbacteria bacterium]|nr:O-antigen ligase family protein [Candidatus Moranbacteria bacterium]
MANLTEKSQEIWEKIKKQPKDIWFFYLFLLTFTLGVRKVILYFPLKGAFNEYTGAYVYASDIFLCLTIIAWVVSILYNKIALSSSNSEAVSEVIHRMDGGEKEEFKVSHKLSTGKFAYFKAFFSRMWKMFHVEQFYNQNSRKCSTLLRQGFGGQAWNILSGLGTIPLLLVIWSFISVFWSENQVISVCRSIKFFELYLLFIYISIRFVPYCLLNCSTWNNLQSGNVPPSCAEASAGRRGTFSNTEDGGDAKMFHVEQFSYVLSKMAKYFRAILLGLVVIALFDHYLWDIWQGQVLFWLVCGVLAGVSFGEQFNLKKCSTWNIFESTISEIVPRGTIYAGRLFFGIIMLLGVTQSLIGIAQFIVQHSIGLFWLKESLIGQSIPGVAKIIANHHVLIRSYGLFPHPNILGGFLFFSIMITLLYRKMFHPEESENVPRGTFSNHGTGAEHTEEKNNVNCSTWNNFRQVWKNVPRGTFWILLKEKVLIMGNVINLILLIQIFGILLSFSKSAVLTLLIALTYINVPRGTFWGKRGKSFHPEKSEIVPRGTISDHGAGVERFRILLGLGLAVLAGLFFLRVEFYALFMKSLAERGLYLSISERIITDNPIIGVGTGQFIVAAERLFPNLEIWQYQPVHNVFLLIWSEWGIVGLVLFIVFLWKLFHVEQFCEKPLLPQGEDLPEMQIVAGG